LTDSLNDLSFRALFDAVVDAMLLVDDAGHVVLANPAAQQILGYTQDELSGLAVEMLMPPRYRKQHRHYRASFFSKPEKRSMGDGKELAALSRNDKELKLDIGLSPIKVQKKIYILVTFNVAERRHAAEEALRTSEERLRLAKQAANLGIYDCDCKRKIIYWDEKMRELWGRSDETVTYEEFTAAIHPEDRAARKAAFNYATAIDATSDGGFNAEYRIINPINGIERWIASTGRVYFENGCAHRLVGVVRDVTEQKNLQKKLQVQRDETENLFKQQVAARTASAIAHELNQPLTAVSAYSEVALRALHNDAIDADNLKKALEGCVEQAQRAGRSLHELLAFLQKSEIKTERLNLNDLINEALNIARNDGYGEFYPVLQLEQNLPAVQGNRTQVQKVLVNLFRNAVEAMRIADAPSSKITILVQSLAEKNMALVIIQDSGPGLDKVMAKHVFEPFFSTKPNGIGMGLAISRSLIEANGGQLWVDPDAKPGAKFYFTLPLAP
jgi:two-component system, LuxR family, sensor kinase FixL